MQWPAVALAALVSAAPLSAQSAPAATDLSYVQPITGTWTYSATAGGSQATFADSSAARQLTIRCTRASRQVTIVKPSSSAAPLLWIWTTAEVKSVPATFDAASASISATFPAFDPMLDAIASSRGRIGFSTAGLAALVVPPWAEVGRVIEDCRV